MSLLDFPTELILPIIDYLSTDRDRSAFIRTNSNLYERFLITTQAKATDKQAVLHWTCINGNPGLASLMLHLGAKADLVPFSRTTRAPLGVALWSSQLEVANVIMNHDPSTINRWARNQFARSTNTETAIGTAIKTQNKNAVAILLARPELNPDAYDRRSMDRSPYLRMALACADPRSEDIIDLLLSDSRFVLDPVTLGEVASFKLSLRCIGRCLRVGIDHVAEVGGTMLCNAVCQNRQDLVKFLLTELDKIDPAILSGREESAALCTAATHANEAVIKLLLARKTVDVDSKATSNWSRPLISATERGAAGIVELLVKTGQADVNATVPGGGLPLSVAAKNGFVKITRFLLSLPAVGPDSRD